MVGRVPAFQLGGPGSIPGWIRDYPGTESVSFVFVLSCALPGGGPDILLTTDLGKPALVHPCSVLVHSLCYLYRHLTHGHLDCKFQGVEVLHWGE